MDPADLERRIGPKTKLVWLEAPGSVTMEFRRCRRSRMSAGARGVTTALDNTWGAGLAFNGFAPGSGADIVVQALTKYPSGGGDVLMGSIVTRDEALHVR
jgi:cystathionine beta-lyase